MRKQRFRVLKIFVVRVWWSYAMKKAKSDTLESFFNSKEKFKSVLCEERKLV